MKKILSVLVAGALFFTGCQQATQEETPQETQQAVNINTVIESATGNEVDLSNIPCTEDVTVSRAVKIKNGDFGGKTLTVNVSGVILENAKNVDIVVAESVGDGDFTTSASDVSSFKVLGGGANSIHVKDTAVKVINIAKANVRVALEGKSTVTKLQLKKGITAKVEVKSSEVKVEAAEVVAEDGSKVEGESVQITVDDGVTFTVPSGSVKKPSDNHKHTYGDWETVKAPTCTEKGQKKHKCTGCDKEETAEIDAKGHSFAAEWETDKDNHWHKATCGHDTEKSALGAHADSDSDGKCDVCSFDMTADWPEPEFVFDALRRTGEEDDSDLLIYLGTPGYIENFKFCEETMTGEGWGRYRGTAFILTPKIVETIDEITGAPEYKILIDENNVNIENVDGLKADVIYFNEVSEDNNFNCRYYILYNELFKNCNNAGIKITSDVSKACEAFENAAAKAGIFRAYEG